MIMSFLKNQDISPLEEILISDGKIVPVDYQQIEDFPQELISLFCVKYGIYQVPTTELIAFLASEISGLDTIEIGAGNGCIGRALNIHMTDNMQQNWPEVKNFYEALRQAICNYGDDVEEMDANDAVLKYKPECVVGCWITEKWSPGDKKGNMYGPNECKMFVDGIKKYIMVGNTNTHAGKKLERIYKPKKLKFPWLISRSMNKNDNLIYIFE